MKRKKTKREVFEGIVITFIGLAIAGVGIDMIFPRRKYASGEIPMKDITPGNNAKEAE